MTIRAMGPWQLAAETPNLMASDTTIPLTHQSLLREELE